MNLIKFKNAPLNFSILIFSFVLLLSCEYELSDTYMNRTNKDVSLPSITTLNNFLLLDTITIIDDTEIKFAFQSTPQNILQVIFKLNGDEIYTTYSDSGNFELNMIDLKEGTHQLSATIYTDSGTGSIAESLNREGFVFENTWTLKVKGYGLTVASESISNGFMQVSWPQFYGLDYYTVVRRYGSGPDKTWKTKELSIIDSTNVGELCRYVVYAHRGDDKYGWSLLEPNSKIRIPKFKMFADETNSYYLHIDKGPFFNAIGNFTFEEEYSDVTYDKSDFINDTTIKVKEAEFGDLKTYSLVTHPKYREIYDTQDRYYYTYEEGITVGHKMNIEDYSISASYLWKVSPGLVLIKMYSNKGFLLYSLLDEAIVGQLVLADNHNSNSDISSIISYGTILSMDAYGDMNFYNSSNFELKRTLKFPYANPDNYRISGITDNGLMLLSKRYSYHYQGFEIYDCNSQKVLAEFTQWDVDARDISLTGKYITTHTDSIRLLMYDGVGLKRIHVEDKSNIDYMILNTFNEEELVTIDNNGVFAIRNCSDFTIKNQFSIAGESFRGIDFEKHIMMTYKGHNTLIKDIYSGDVIKQLPFINYRAELIGKTLVDLIGGVTYDFIN